MPNDLTEAANGAVYGFLLRTREAEEVNSYLTSEHSQLALVALLRLAFTSGARWSLRTSSELSPHIAKFIEMMVLLGYLEPDEPLTEIPILTDAEREAIANVEVSSLRAPF